MAARGTLAPHEAIEARSDHSCCASTGVEMKVYDNIRVEGDVGREVAEYSLEMCISAIRAEYTEKGGRDNTVIERIFSPMAYLVMCGTIKKGRVLYLILTTFKINDRGSSL